MKIDRLVVGELQENCYIVTIKNNSIIIDPGDEAEKIIKASKDLNVVEIFVTHNHFDHIGALERLEKYFGLKAGRCTHLFDYQVINTPGHTKDSKSLYFEKEKVMFVGDFIFQGSIGRTDLGGNSADMFNSLKMMMKYPDDVTLFPGHGDKTSLGWEKNNFKYYFEWLQ